MYKNMFGLFTVLLCAVCIILGLECLRKHRYGLSIVFFLNAFTNLVNSIHAFFGTLL